MTVKIYKVDTTAYSKINSVVSQDHFARNGYILKSAKSLDINIPEYILFIEGQQEFFDDHENEVKVEGVKEVTGTEFETIKNAIDAEQASVAGGIALFD